MQFLSGSRPKSKCVVCGKNILVRSTKGEQAKGFCSRVCAAMKRYAKRYTGGRSQIYDSPINLERKRHA